MRWPERLDPRRSWTGFLLTAGLGLAALFILLDPAPSRGLGLPAKAAFWLLHSLGILALAQACQLVLSRHARAFGNVWVSVAAAGLAASALFAPLALGLDHLFGLPDDAAGDAGGLLIRGLDEWRWLAPPVTLVWLGLNAVRVLRLRVETPSAPVEGGTPGPARPGFLGRLPAGRRGDLIALSAELHYLRVYTTSGDALLLKGFGEAQAELGPDAGLRIHRSHWIAPAHAVEVSRGGGRMQVRLANGLVLPVARSRRGEVTAAIERQVVSVEA
ncbi:MAG: LytTR family DNA-binding domain-containing protein [Brevundimonas sp.]